MDRITRGTELTLTAGVAILITLAVIAGGATWQGSPSEAWVILPAIPLLSLAVFLHFARGPFDWTALALVFVTLALPLLHAVPWPWPPAPWASVHSTWQLDQALVFGVTPTSTLSIAPDASIRAFLALLPPAAVFLCLRLLPSRRQWQIATTIFALALASAALGLLQSALGDTFDASPFGTNSGQAKGFFSNRNHFAALMYVGIAVGGAGLLTALRRMLADHSPARHGPRVIAWAAGFLLLIVACMVAQSRAGVAIGAGVVIALFGVILVDTARSAKGSRRLFTLIAVSAVLAAVQIGLWGVLERFKADPFEDGRVVVQATTLGAARESLPWGTGIGTFRRIYEQREPLDSVIGSWVNRAHNDWLEFFLEAGWIGVALLLAWIGWWVLSLITARTRVSQDRELRLLRSLAAVAVVAIAVHSLVDFPLRTIALFSVTASLVVISTGPRRLPGIVDGRVAGHTVQRDGTSDLAPGRVPG
jgi:O-antigen ligase